MDSPKNTTLEYTDKQGVKSYIEQDKYWGEFPEEELDKVINLMKRGSYDKAREYIDTTLNRSDFIFGKGRSDFIYYFNLSKDSVCLDCGSGLGVTTFNLAPHVKEVHSFDQSLKRVQFSEERRKAENVDNIYMYHTDFLNLPFKDETFDSIVMNGVVEWLGEMKKHQDPREDQIYVLKKLYSKLKKGGKLYIGIENRIATAYLRGYDHSGIRFTNFMPHFLADWVTRRKKGKSYRTYIYTYWGYKKLLRDSGFDVNKAEFYIAYPGYNLPKYIVPFDDIKSLAFFLRNMSGGSKFKGFVLKIISRFGFLVRIFRYFAFSFLIYAEK